MTPPALLGVAHGTRNPAGAAAVGALLDRVRAVRPWIEVGEAYAEIAEPSLEDGLAGLARPVVAVPLLLARGYHALVDIPGRVERARPDAVTARQLGPHSLLAAALMDRLGRGRLADGVVLGAAGSSDPAGVADVRTAAVLLSRRLGRPVRHGFVGTALPSLPDVVRDLRQRGARRIAVASYLLAPGFFHDQLAAAGADLVSPPLGGHEAVVRLILRRYDEAALQSRQPRMAAG